MEITEGFTTEITEAAEAGRAPACSRRTAGRRSGNASSLTTVTRELVFPDLLPADRAKRGATSAACTPLAPLTLW
jgi:hypothetical protein